MCRDPVQAGLQCQCCTLFAGLLCQSVGRVDEATNAILGWFALSAMAFFTGLILQYWTKALKVTIKRKVQQLLGNAPSGAAEDADGRGDNDKYTVDGDNEAFQDAKDTTDRALPSGLKSKSNNSKSKRGR
eukprot:SAG22_NODE_584_length_8876_cov_42.811667_8_plen_130_part_00